MTNLQILIVEDEIELLHDIAKGLALKGYAVDQADNGRTGYQMAVDEEYDLIVLPGLNCYSCPAAAASCPIGALQAVIGSSRFQFAYYIVGILIFFGVLLGRAVCGFLCPFGWFQELLHKIPTKKFSTKRLHILTYLKYVILAVFVIVLPMTIVNEVGLGDPFFCKYICPAGILEGGIPLSLANAGIRASLEQFSK